MIRWDVVENLKFEIEKLLLFLRLLNVALERKLRNFNRLISWTSNNNIIFFFIILLVLLVHNILTWKFFFNELQFMNAL